VPARTTTTATDARDLARALAFARRQLRGAAEHAIAHPFGEAFVDTRLPLAHVLNSLHVDAEVDADQLVAALDDLYAGYAHRRADVEVEDTGARLAPDLRRRRWQVERDAVMALRRPRDRDGDRALAREADAATHRAVDAATLRGEPYGRDEDVVRQLVEMRARFAAAVPVTRWFVGAADGVDAAVTTLYSDGAVAQIEDVVTLADYRGRGLARAMLTLALDAAAETGHELVFIVADDDDWPKDLYGRLGFDVVGHRWAFTRTERRAGG
jgi:ribosomal protein S18 acetylase RimI-like enzyme